VINQMKYPERIYVSTIESKDFTMVRLIALSVVVIFLALYGLMLV